MKILTAQQIHAWDEFTIQHEPVASIDLMERAALQCVEWLITNNFSEHHFKIFCGKGNNGGDGLAIARMLMQRDIPVTVYILEFGALGTIDFQINLQRLHAVTSNIHFIQNDNFFPVIDTNDIVIDALFGSGLNRPLQNITATLVEHINQSNATVIAVDIPSGMSADNASAKSIVIKAKHTLTFQCTKLCFLLAENAINFGNVHLLNINLHPSFIETIDAVFQTIEQSFISSIIKKRNAFAHKGNFGHALLVAGNTGKTGAAVIAAKACLRSGVGLLTVNIPSEERNILQISISEAMVALREEEKINYENYACIGIGPGLGTDATSYNLLKNILLNYKKPMLIDADALNIISEHKDLLRLIPPDSILTPHPKEFDRLFGNHENEFDRLNKCIELSKQYSFVIALKNHHTLIACNGKGWFNTTGNAGLAKGGSGDSLSGIITALLSQKYSSLHAALIGVYLHGLAADISLETQSVESLLATDVVENIGKAFMFLQEEEKPFLA
ncbi:MAG: bifunctional ADP-dependent NAD(P)H-hydrate dehydratase/NAD(P)H-hydrate epimerase [Chitinophaga sp.]|jgi:ADP-dependent NAD(P)H-hydrate dehydratase / NAD(P)H-hydrate epimerase|nr:bifunctional ADP-dependent NAD(P)H-hydrate dehydratase/NAD(P)H-hydrate epimerase [Chitinophaga sp.]